MYVNCCFPSMGCGDLSNEVSQLRRGSPTATFCATIASAGGRLAAVLPRASNDVNELSDALVLIE
jgi:uncharacterized membrane protein